MSRDGRPVTLRSLGPSVYLPSLLFFIGDGAVLPLVAFAALDLGASPAMAGFIVALRGLGVLAFDVPAGWLISRFGERVGIGAASLTVVLTLVGWALTDSIVVFALLAFVQGCGWSAWQLARLAYVADVVPPELRGRAMSLLGGVIRIGMLVGPFAAAAITALGGVDAVFAFAAVLGVVAAAVLFATVPAGESRTRAGAPVPVRAIVREHAGVLFTAGLTATCVQGLRQARNALLPLWADHIGLSPSTASLIFGLSLVFEVALVYPGGTLIDRGGRKAVAVPCLVLMGLGLALLPLTHDVVQLSLVAALLGLGNGISSGVVMTLGADLAPPETRVAFLGVWRVFGDAGVAGGPLAVAAATAATTLGGAAVIVGAAGLLAAVYVVRFVPETLRR